MILLRVFLKQYSLYKQFSTEPCFFLEGLMNKKQVPKDNISTKF